MNYLLQIELNESSIQSDPKN